MEPDNVPRSVSSQTLANTEIQNEKAPTITESTGWSYSTWLHHHEIKKEAENMRKKYLALTWKHLEVKGVSAEAVLGDHIISAVNPVEILKGFKAPETTTILHDLTGQVLPGEMLLVLGRPGSGCTTFLKAVANKHESYASVNGEIFYGSMTAKEAKNYRASIIYNSEEDIHFPTLTVAQTLGFALKTRVFRPLKKKGTVKEHINELLHVVTGALGIGHTKETLVGNEFVRGVSGGERKRVTVGEVMAAQGSVTCWDNATRGLDASTALEFASTLRHMADKSKTTILATLYQAGNGIYQQFDKVLVLDGGRQIYFGPRILAKSYFEDLGFECPPGANIADFLTSVTVPTERRIRRGYELTAPKTAEELERVYKESTISQMMQRETVDIAQFAEHTADLKQAIQDEQPKYMPLQGVYTISLWDQTVACIVREVHIMLGDRASMAMQQVSAIIQSLVAGSLYYNLPTTSDGIFSRTGALFYPVLFFNMSAASEVVATFSGRTILARHRDFGLYRPTAYVIARMITDVPMALMQVTIFALIFYFMAGFQVDAGKFFTFWLLTIISAVTALSTFRMIGSWFRTFDNASKISGIWLMISMVYAGYFIPYGQMHPWFKWYYWLNPAAYTYEALMANEFGGLSLTCAGSSLVPNGDSYLGTSNHVCTVAGATEDQTTINGNVYMSAAYGFSTAHIWRNFGIILAWWFSFTAMTALALENRHKDTGNKSSLVFNRSKERVDAIRKKNDEEKAISDSSATSTSGATDDLRIARNEAIFTWDKLCYTVSVPGGHRQLLDNITGWVKPGQLGALMGSSGAGKTTLLDVLAQRKDVGVVTGEVLVDGRSPPQSFQRSAGYCEQMDVHEGTSTVREALLFSARLRQPVETPDEEKVAYVEQVIRLLELETIQDAFIGVPGAGLTVEQRKRVTIGVELAAKPSILLFLDEPTSGLDGQSAFNVVRFLRRLADAGQAVLCTIHQPSASLFESFDSLLLLAKGGKTVYFGETGKDSSTVLSYFANNGAPCDPDANPAEHIIDVVSTPANDGRLWHDIWMESPERVTVMEELARIKSAALSRPSSINDDSRPFATPIMTQMRLVTHRAQVALWRNPDYVWNKIFIHVTNSLLSGFTFWNLGSNVSSLQLRLLTVFNFLFVAVGCINQLQPLFIHNRDIFEAREKKSKMYSWVTFVTAQLVSEFPYLIACGVIYFVCWYFTVGLPVTASTSGQVFVTMIFYEFLYTAIGQGIAAISPNDFFASLLNPVIMGAFLTNFAGVLVSYSNMVVFWKYWMYYLDPFTYLIGALLTQILDDVQVTCSASELYSFALPDGQTCGQYMADYFASGAAGYVTNANATGDCQFCQYKDGSQFAATLNMNKRSYGWRDTGIVALFCVATYGFVFLMMKFRTKKTKSAKLE